MDQKAKYVKTNWIDKKTIITANNMNKLENQVDVLTDSLELANASLNERATKNEIEIERRRIDNIVAVKNSVDNLETADIRTGANNVIYESAGDAVRDQFKDTITKYSGVSYENLDEGMKEIVGSKKTPYIISYKDGYYMGTNLQEVVFPSARYGQITGLREGEFIYIDGVVQGSLVYAIIFVDNLNKLISKHFVGNDSGGIEYNTCIQVPKKAVKCYINNYGKKLVFSKYEVSTIPMERLKDFSKLSIYEEEQTIALSESNTELLLGKTYTTWGSFQTDEYYSTLYYPVGKYNSFLLYKVGVYGGAFVTHDKKWISSFATDGANTSIKKEVPQSAYYIAISVLNSDKYKPIKGYINRTTYSLDNLKISQFNLTEVEEHLKGLNNISGTNQWKGKKIGILGTSVAFGQYSTKSYAMEIQNKLGCTVKNFSLPGLALHTQENGNKLSYGSFVLTKSEYQSQGQTLPSSPVLYTPGGSYNDYYRSYENVFTQDNADIDLWVFAVAPNNSRFGLDDWNLFNKDNWSYTNGTNFVDHRTTFIGAILFLMDKMYTLNPNARMILLLDSSFAYANGKSNFETIKSQWNIPVIDLWGKINISPKSLIKLKSKDGADNHPSTFAHEIMGNMFANEILLYN